MRSPTDTNGEPDERAVEDMSYTEASAELDEIVGFFEGRDVDVDQLVGRLVRATAIIEELDKRLRRTRVQVEQLVPRLAAVLDEAPDDGPPPYEPQPEDTSGDDVDDAAGGAVPEDEIGAGRTSPRARGDGDEETPGLF